MKDSALFHLRGREEVIIRLINHWSTIVPSNRIWRYASEIIDYSRIVDLSLALFPEIWLDSRPLFILLELIYPVDNQYAGKVAIIITELCLNAISKLFVYIKYYIVYSIENNISNRQDILSIIMDYGCTNTNHTIRK